MESPRANIRGQPGQPIAISLGQGARLLRSAGAESKLLLDSSNFDVILNQLDSNRFEKTQ